MAPEPRRMLCHRLNVVSDRSRSFWACASEARDDRLDVARQLRKAIRRTVRVASFPVAAPVPHRVGRTDREAAPAGRTKAEALRALLINVDIERRHDGSEQEPAAQTPA